MFKGIKDNWKKAEAAAIIQTLLEDQVRLGLLDADPASVANALVAKAWEGRPEWFDGRDGLRPHKAATAAVILAMAADTLPVSGRLHGPVMVCLCEMTADLEVGGHLLALTSKDHRMLAFSREILAKVTERLESSELDSELEMMMGRAADRHDQG